MKEYRAQLDADRAQRLSKGTNNAHLRVKAEDMKTKARFHSQSWWMQAVWQSSRVRICSSPVAQTCIARCWQLLEAQQLRHRVLADVHVSVIRRGRRRSRRGRTRTRRRSRRKTARTRRRRARGKKTLAAIAATAVEVMTGKPESLMVLSACRISCKESK